MARTLDPYINAWTDGRSVINPLDFNMLRNIFSSTISFARQTQAPPREEDKTVTRNDNKLRLTSRLQVFCESCRELDERCIVRFKLAPKLTNNRRPGRKRTQLHNNFTELEGCATEGCSACLVWTKILLRECPTKEMELDLQQSKSPIWAVLPATLSEPWIITIETQIRAGDAFSAIAILQDSADTPSLHKDPASTEVISMIKNWYNECHENTGDLNPHSKCFKFWDFSRDDRENFRPKRLLSIKSEDRHPDSVRLVSGGQVKTDDLYVALSYCWGSSDNYKTTAANEEEHKKSISITNLPRTIQDAIRMCRHLEIGYLWVDALCILQDKDSPEWSIEASNLDRIYGFATFTLAISSSKNASDGFLQKRNAEALRTKQSEKATIGQTAVQIPHKSLQTIKKTCPLDTRGWAFQEEKLSPRIVHWTAHGIFWTCLSGTCTETMPQFLPHNLGLETLYYQDFQQAEYENFGDGYSRTFQIEYAWLQSIEDYSTRDFEKIADRLPALSGMAKRYFSEISKSEPDEEYLAGVWLYSLHKGLLWTVQDRVNSAAGSTSKLDIAPSWSWASVPAKKGIRYPLRFGRSTTRVIDYKVELADKEKFGAITKAMIRLEARLRPLTEGDEVEWPNNGSKDENENPRFPTSTVGVYALDREKGRILISHLPNAPVLVKLDYEIPATLESCYCLEISRSGFLLLMKLQGFDEYERIGCAPWHEDGTFFEGFPAMEVSLAWARKKAVDSVT